MRLSKMLINHWIWKKKRRVEKKAIFYMHYGLLLDLYYIHIIIAQAFVYFIISRLAEHKRRYRHRQKKYYRQCRHNGEHDGVFFAFGHISRSSPAALLARRHSLSRRKRVSSNACFLQRCSSGIARALRCKS